MWSRWRFLLACALLLNLLLVPLASLGEVPGGRTTDDSRAFAGGDGTPGNPYRISNVIQLQGMGDDLAAHYALVNDIDASATKDWNDGKGFDPVGSSSGDAFSGSLDGRNHTIADLSIEFYDSFVGMVGYSGGGRIENVILKDVYVASNEYVGGLVGENRDGIIRNCHVEGAVSGTSIIGGLVGYNKGSVSHSHTEGYVSGRERIGGLIGFNADAVVDNCSSSARVTGSYNYNGGLLGTNYEGTVLNSHSTGDVSGGDNCGGLIGANSGAVEGCYATGSVSGDDSVGGLSGYNSETMVDSFALGDVTGASDVGGLLGFNGEGAVAKCYSIGSVSGSTEAGGLVGNNFRGTVSSSFWDTATSNMHTSSGGTGEGTDDMKSSTTFKDAGWDLWDTWMIVEGRSYPMLLSHYTRPVMISDIQDSATATEDVLFSTDFDSSVCWLPGCTNQGNYILSAVCPWLSFSPSGTLSGTPSNDDVGEWNIYVTVRDLTMGSTSLYFVLEVLNVNDPPEILTTFLPDATEDAPYQVQLFGNDIDPPGDDLNWSLETNVPFLSMDQATATLSGTPANREVGEWQVTLVLDDGHGGRATRTLSLTVLNVNDDPFISTITLPEAPEDEAYSFRLRASDNDPTDDVLTWRLVDTDADFLDLDPSTGELTGTPDNDDVGEWWLEVEVEDGLGGMATATLALEVVNVNDAPEITTVAVPEAWEDTEYSYKIKATDIDPTGDEFLWSISTDASFLSIEPDTGEMKGTPTNGDVGEWVVTITVSDNEGGVDSKDVTLTVVNVNDAPEVVSFEPPDGTAYEKGELVSFSVVVDDADGDAPTVTWKADGLTIGTGTSCQYSDLLPGQHNITITVTDGDLTTVEEFVLTTTKKKGSNGGSEESPGFELAVALAVLVLASLVVRRRR